MFKVLLFLVEIYCEECGICKFDIVEYFEVIDVVCFVLIVFKFEDEIFVLVLLAVLFILDGVV